MTNENYAEVRRLLDRAALALEAGQYLKAEQLVAQAGQVLRRQRGAR